jgi:hypothetical protein
MSDKPPLSNIDLRTRIAAALADADGMPWNEWSQPAQDGYLLRADAVIMVLIPESSTDWKADDE